MRPAPLALALWLATPAALAAPAQAQPAAGWTALNCDAASRSPDRAAVMRLSEVTEGAPDSNPRICLTGFDLPAGAPYRRLVVFQVWGSYWCGTAGCTTFIYGRDAAGRWVDISPMDTMTNAQEESVRISRARAFRGMPRLAIRTGGGGGRPGTAEWGWIPRLGRYSD